MVSCEASSEPLRRDFNGIPLPKISKPVGTKWKTFSLLPTLPVRFWIENNAKTGQFAVLCMELELHSEKHSPLSLLPMDLAAQSVIVESPNEATAVARLPVKTWELVVLAGLIGILYRSILWRLGNQWWTDPNFSHGVFVPFFSAFVVWRNRKSFAAIPLRQTWAGLPVVLFSLCTLVVGVLGAELFLSRTSLIFLVGGLIIYFAGWQLFRALLFPWLVLFLMVPIPSIVFNQITLPLQFLASQLATDILRGLGVPVLCEGNVITLPSMPLEVAEACSGIRSLMSLGTMAIIYGYVADSKVWRRVVLAGMSIPIAIAANALRLVGTGLTVQYWDPEKGQGFFHEFSGWLIFVFSLAMLYGLHLLLQAVDRSGVRKR